MHTTCVPVVVDVCPTSPYIAQDMGASSTLATHRMHLLLTDDQNAWLQGQASGLRNKSAVVRDLIDTARQGLDRSCKLPAYRVGAGAREVERVPAVQAVMPDQPATQPHLQTAVQEGAVEVVADGFEPEKKSIKPKNKTAKFVFSVPPELSQVKEDLLEYWRDYKSGKKTRAAAGLLITGCQSILDQYGVTVLKEQIQLACANNWQSITLKGYEQFGLTTKKGFIPAQPDHKHPAYRDASEVIAESERLAQQNVEHLRRKAEEAEETTNPILEELFL